MQLQKLLKEIPSCQIEGDDTIDITGITTHSQLVAPGHLYIAKKGRNHDGNQFISQAIQAGANAIVTSLFDPSLKKIVQVIHPQISLIEGALAATYYQHPSQELLMVGITGTNGKTTTSFIIKHLFDDFLGPCGLIGTIEYIVGKHRYPASYTTPDVVTNHKLLREMVVQGCRTAVMEVSSHGLDQGRVDKIDFDVAIFSNLTLEHLDYHGTMENYAAAKRKIFTQLGQERSHKGRMKWAIVNQNSPWTPYLLSGSSANILSYGIDSRADLQAVNIRLEKQGTWAQLNFQGQSMECYWPLVGRFNVYNCLAAIATALSQQIPFDVIASRLAQMPPIRGRLQPVINCLGLQIYVDFAHSDDALLNVLMTLQELKKSKGRLIVVFGCGGDRDRNKRPKMAQACEKYADFCIVTSDNPRSEDPYQICKEIIGGFSKPGIYQVEVERKVAIQKAIELAGPHDILLIAGKGHETCQIGAHQTIAFDDDKMAASICRQLASRTLSV